MKFNENLKYLRKEARMTQENLAEELNVSRQAVTKWESGQSLPDIENLKQMADLFEVTMDSLVGDVTTKKESHINKKIKDIDIFIFAAMIFLLSIFFSIHEFVTKITNNDDLVYITSILMGLVLYVVFVIMIKSYFQKTKKSIINMRATEEGKKERKQIIAKDALFKIFISFIYGLIEKIQFLPDGFDKYIIEIGKWTVTSIILFAIIGIWKYKKLEKKTALLNEE